MESCGFGRGVKIWEVFTTFIEPPPACDPCLLAHQVLVVLRDTHRDDVWGERNWFVEPEGFIDFLLDGGNQPQ